MSKVNPKFRYTKSHEWVEFLSSGTVRMGITDHAQASLGDITYFELPEVGKTFKKGDTLGFVESVKAVSDIYAPLAFEVTSVNTTLSETPEVVNQDAYVKGWYAEGKLQDKGQLEDLMDAKAYSTYLASEEG